MDNITKLLILRHLDDISKLTNDSNIQVKILRIMQLVCEEEKEEEEKPEQKFEKTINDNPNLEGGELNE